jgi:hypothetical protein
MMSVDHLSHFTSQIWDKMPGFGEFLKQLKDLVTSQQNFPTENGIGLSNI